MARLLLNSRLFKTVVIGLHGVLFVFLFFAFDMFRNGFWNINSLAPVSEMYQHAGIIWLSNVREISHIILTILDLVVGLLLVNYGLGRKHEVSRFFSVAIGSQFIFSALLSGSLIGLVIWGGAWHFISAVVAMTMAGSALITLTILIMFWKSLVALGDKQDRNLQETEDTL